jgi:cystathionine beta-lyase/cystathionine gamma-synthase
MRFSTRAIHVGQEPDPTTGSVSVPVFLTSTFRQKEPGKEGEYVYSRTANPTRTALEDCLASLEEGHYGLAFSSGMAATANVLLLLQKGDHVIAGDDIYGGTYRLFEQVLRNYGLQFTYVDPQDPSSVERAVRKNTRMIWIETPTNPLMRIIDLRKVSKISRRANAILVVDNTFMSPYLQNPLNHGADIVVHSTTKYLGGHSDLIGGATITSDSNLVLRGIKTLAIRMERHCQNAATVSDYLAKQSKVARVLYPGLADHPHREIVRRQMRGGGGMLSFQLKGGFLNCKKFLKRLKVFTVAESLGGVESLIEHPYSMTHASVPRERRERLGVSDDLIRISAGIEDANDLVEDLESALKSL